ncbi:type VII secretion system-associated protein [Streptomyces sp. NPDC058469]|uniref:type VII secretion system-associated protein n=1 Tax=Streptomyces sp. NPDC058469 TaxID=3346514 RepID=UPI003669AB74
MAESPVTQLDADSIKNFADDDLRILHDDLENLQRQGPGNNAYSVTQFTTGGGASSIFEGMAQPLPIGNMASSAFSSGGAALQSAVEKYVTDLSKILLRQGVITSDLSQALLACVTDMRNNQLSNLDMINMDKAEDIFEYVNRDSHPATATTTTGNTTGTNTNTGLGV